MENYKDIEDYHLSNIKKTICWWPNEVYCGKGGQQVSVSPTGVYIESETTGFCIFINSERSQIKNYELAITLFKLYLSEINK